MGFVFLNETDLEGEVVTRVGLRLRFSDSITIRGSRTSRSLTKVTSSRSRLSETTLGCRSSRSRSTTIGRSWCAISRSAHGLRCSHTPSTDGVKPTTLIFACIDVEAHRVFLTYLYVELVETIFTKDIKYATARVLFGGGFEHERLHFPGISRVIRNARTWFECHNDFTSNFHVKSIIVWYAKVTISFGNDTLASAILWRGRRKLRAVQKKQEKMR